MAWNKEDEDEFFEWMCKSQGEEYAEDYLLNESDNSVYPATQSKTASPKSAKRTSDKRKRCLK